MFVLVKDSAQTLPSPDVQVGDLVWFSDRWRRRLQRACVGVHAAAGVPAPTTGRDAGKRVPGRKRGLAVDVLGLVVAVVALAASAHENTAGIALLDRVGC
jgi:hypothetical protein